MKVTVSVHGRWHAFELATELQDRGLLSQLLTTYPRMAVKQLTTRTLPVTSRPSLEIAVRMIDGGLGASQMVRLLQLSVGLPANRCRPILTYSGVEFRQPGGYPYCPRAGRKSRYREGFNAYPASNGHSSNRV